MDVINSLLRASRAGNLKRVVEFIEDELVDINASNQYGLTALHAASKEGHTHIVAELLARGANVHARTLKGNTPLQIASLAGHEPVVRLLIDAGADVDAQSVSGFTALYMAAQENHESIVKLLLANQANQNIATSEGFTPLAVAMQQGYEQIASILLNNEARGRIRFPGTTESGRSLLHIAAKKDDCAAAALLMQNNISPDVTSKSGFTALHVASHYGNENVAKLLIDRQADVNYQAKHNITPLHVAAKWGQDRLVELLLTNRAKIDATTRDGLTPLHCAARSGHDTVVEDLIRRGAPISAKTRSGLAPLHMATQGDHLKSAQILLKHLAPVDDVTVDYLTALHVASHCGHVQVAKLLLNHQADPNFRALNGFTSLHIACKKNRLKIVELLLKYGASLNAITESGLTPLHVASFMGCVEIVIYLLDNNANIEPVTVRGETPLHLAVRANQIDVIHVLLEYGADASAQAKESQTALHIASRLGNLEIVRLLLQRGVDIDATTKGSYTALHIAAKEGHEEIVALLLDHGANISRTTKNHGFTPLHLASKYGTDGVVDLLLSYGALVDAQGKNGVTPLHVATHYDQPSVVQLLLADRGPQQPGASPHAMAKNGYTALHIAARGNRLDITNALLQYNADPNAESNAGFCPLHLAAQEGKTDMAALLLNNGAQVNCRAKNGITPLHLCAQEDHVNVAQLLVKRGAYLDEQTKGGFTPLHVASHFARIKMIRFLLANGANVNIPAASGYTPLHQASQQGNPEIVKLLLQYNAKPDTLTENGQTALSIAENLGYVSIIETLKVVTETVVKTTTVTVTEEKFKMVSPETMQETFVSDSEDEADDHAHAESVKFLTTDVMRNFNMSDDYNTSHSNLAAVNGAAESTMQQQRHQLEGGRAQSPGSQLLAGNSQLIQDEMQQDLTYLSREAPLDGGESTFGGAASYGQLAGSQRDESVMRLGGEFQDEEPTSQEDYVERERERQAALNQLAPDNVDIQKPMQQAGAHQSSSISNNNNNDRPIEVPTTTSQLKPFLVSFMVDARGGAMRGCRHSGVRVIIPPNSAQMPTRITCRYLRRERLVHPPPLMEDEACASKIIEVGPAGAKFLGPVLIEVPHFASLRGQEREIIILRSDSGDVWREHLVEPDERLVDSIIRSAPAEISDETGTDKENSAEKRLTRIVTNEFPQYFAIISRIRQEVHAVGPDGLTVNSQVVPRVQAIFTEGALTKRIKIGLQPKGTNKANSSNEKLHLRPASPAQGQAASSEQLDSLESNASQRPTSPASQQSQTGAKRRSRFLACFGAGHGSVDLLNSATDESSTGGDSPGRQRCQEKPCKRRHIVNDVEESDDAASASSSVSGASPSKHKRNKRHLIAEQLVPEDYYIEHEPPLILNVEPTTFGKRLASSSAQTDAKLNGKSTSRVRAPKSRSLLRGGKLRKNKAQLTIRCDSAASQTRPKSAEPPVVDSSLELDENLPAQLDSISVIHEVITSDDQKWRTCTIQTDSDSITVNYVTTESGGSAAAASTADAKTGHDDGYVSGSGDLQKTVNDKTTSYGKGIFGLSFKQPAVSVSEVAETNQTKKEKKKEKPKRPKKEKPQVALAATSGDESNEPTSQSSSSFLARLFKRKPAAAAAKVEVDAASKVEPQTAAPSSQAERPVIVSEMYPSDPDDADGEMILEVNVPENLIDSTRSSQQPAAESSHASEPASTLGNAPITIDEDLVMTSCEQPPVIVKTDEQQPEASKLGELEEDDQATLVNISQMITSEVDGVGSDDEATENVVSQAIELSAEPTTVEQAVDASQEEPESWKEAVKEKQSRKQSKKSLSEAKSQKELEAELQKEAKKQAQEEARQKKLAAKEEAKQKKLADERAKQERKEAELAAKKLAKEEKERAKLEAKEAAKKAKNAKKKAAPSTSDQVEGQVSSAEAKQVESSEDAVRENPQENPDGDMQPPEKPEGDEKSDEQQEQLPEGVEVNTKTEMERIVEEVVGEDGIVTKTTRTIETKYVTTRQEELLVSERRDIPIEEFERSVLDESLGSPPVATSSKSPEETVGEERRVLIVAPYEHAELEALRATPSYFSREIVLEDQKVPLSAKKEMRLRIKLNQKLIKRAHKLAKSECQRAKKSKQKAESEIAVCDEAAKEAQKELKRALKEAKRAGKLTAKAHKQMDKMDKKLAKRQKKIEKRQKKLDKAAAKLAKKEAKRREKLAKKESKKAKSKSKSSTSSRSDLTQLERKSSQKSKKSIKLEDIGQPILKSSSRLSIGGAELVPRRGSPGSELDEVEMSLDDQQEAVVHTITRTVVTEHPDGRIEEQVSQQVLSGAEAQAAGQLMEAELDQARQQVDEEIIEVVNVESQRPEEQNHH